MTKRQRIACGIIGGLGFCYIAFDAYRDATVKSDYTWLFVLLLMALFLGAFTIPTIRNYIGERPKVVSRVGWCVLAAGLAIFGIDIYNAGTSSDGNGRGSLTTLAVYMTLTGVGIMQLAKLIPPYLKRRSEERKD